MTRIPSLLATAAVALVGCSAFEPDYIACPTISVLDGAEKITTVGAELGQVVTVRVNGAGARCTDNGNGVDMEFELGLMIKRDMENIDKSERVVVDTTMAFLDSDGQVTERLVFSKDAFIPDYQIKSRPILSINTKVPAGMRVVFGLGRAE